MRAAKWTDEQLTAITTRHCNLLVAAAAGSGKTAVLVERLIRMITDQQNPIDVDRFLVVTFTKAAAAEMRERIGTAIAKELNNQPGSRHLNRQSILLNKAAITNLHSFCLDILRQYFYKIELDPTFKVADDNEAELLKIDALEDVFEAAYESGNTYFLQLVESYGGDRDDSQLQEIVLNLYNFSSAHPWPEEWLRQNTNNYLNANTGDIENQPWGKIIMDWLQIELTGCLDDLEQANTLANKPGGPVAYSVNLKAEIIFLNELIQSVAVSWSKVYAQINSFQFQRLASCGKDIDDTLKDKVKNLRATIKNKISKIKDNYFSRQPIEYLADMQKMAPLVDNLCQLVLKFSLRYRQLKIAKSIVDFNDLEHFCLQILMDQQSTPGNIIPSQVALILRAKFAEVLVDEYQDINAVQETLLWLLSNQDAEQPNLFMVGDVKQSIYRFRLAEPALFMAKYLNYPRESGYKNQAVDLAKNFRSRPEIVNGVNYIFRQIMTENVGEMIYDHKAELICGADYLSERRLNTIDSPIELHLLEKKKVAEGTDLLNEEETDFTDEDTTNNDYSFDELDATQREALLVADKIQKIVQGNEQTGPYQIFDKNMAEYRPVRYQDIVILMRATRGTANTFVEELRNCGIPAFADLTSGYFAAIEIEIMLSLLKVIDNPRQDIPLAAVLRSPIVGLKASEMASVRIAVPKGDYYDGLVKAASTDESDALKIKPKLNKFLQQLTAWRTISRRGPLSDLIWQLYKDTGYYAYVGAMPGGAQRQANLRSLHDRARQYEATNFRGLFRFLRFIDRIREKGSDLGTARALGENEDVIRIMSIHKSKGLEFPIVFVVNLGKQFNLSDINAKAILHKEIGLGMPVVDTDLRITYPTLIQESIKKLQLKELLAEEMRILYVALTRAREKLILVGSVNNLEKNIRRWCDYVSRPQLTLPDALLANAKTYLDWLLPALSRHPDAQNLREFTPQQNPAETNIIVDPAQWQIFFWPMTNDFIPNQDNMINNEWIIKPIAQMKPIESDQTYFDLITQRLKWQYPHENITGKSAKIAVTEVKRKFLSSHVTEESIAIYQPTLTNRPLFIQDKTGLTAAERGSALHMGMQHIDFNDDISVAGLKSQIDNLTKKDLLTLEQAQSININSIHTFLSSPLGQRLINAQSIKKELPFTLALPAYIIYPELSPENEEQLLVQGVIDCLFTDDKGIVIIDYKTDHLGQDTNIEAIINRYAGQLNLYAKAVETIYKQSVNEKYLYLFTSGDIVPIK